MRKWYSIFPKKPWISIYTWIILCFLPFFFIFKSSSFVEIGIGITLLIMFFISYIFSFKSKSGLVYMWLSFEMIVNIAMIYLFGFVYFAIFTAIFIGNIRHYAGFFIMYGLHIATTVGAVIFGYFFRLDLLLPQTPYIVISVIGTVLLPFHLYNRTKRENLEGELEVAREKISELIIFEERQRIARDLHDILGQKLSLIGLKSDLAGKLLEKDSELAKDELKDIRITASTALKEVRELVTHMRYRKLTDELQRTKQVLEAAEIDVAIKNELIDESIPPVIENILSLCLKEAVTNIVKHSGATKSDIYMTQNEEAYILKIKDDGRGFPKDKNQSFGSGIAGMRERLEFVNGTLYIESNNGTDLLMEVPVIIKNIAKGSVM
ncbi:sensor histidine kinase [Pseudogracilibacillus sp. ICA-222130]|uniref:sensor histidine kinase n=1 Tax=Pseudogracilibacillus sp. ICA-222130 TaxID=3134655 RepID=UPI0030C026AF